MAQLSNLQQATTLNVADESLLRQSGIDKRIKFSVAEAISWGRRSGYTYKGEYSTDPQLTDEDDFVFYEGLTYFGVGGLSYPYTIDSGTYTNPENDNNLTKNKSTENFLTLDDALLDTNLSQGVVIRIKERSTGTGGESTWDVVLTSTVTPNTANVVQSTAIPTISFVLRSASDTDGRAFGLKGDDSTDDKAILTIIDSLGGCKLTSGTYRIASNLSLTGDYIWEGAVLKGDNAVQITFTKQITAGHTKIFDTSNNCEFFIAFAHTFTQIRAAWFGLVLGNNTTLVQGTANMRSLVEATTMAGKGVPDGFGNTPEMKMPVGALGLNAYNSTGVDVKSYQAIYGFHDSTFLYVVVGAEAFDVFTVSEPGANSVIFDDFLISGNQGELGQVNTHNGIVFAPSAARAIYCRIGTGTYIKEMSGRGIDVTDLGLADSVISPFISRDNRLGNLRILAGEDLDIYGKYRSSKGTSNGVELNGPDVGDINFYGTSEENGGHGIYASSISGRLKIKDDASFDRNGLNNIRLEQCVRAQIGGCDTRQATQASVYLLECTSADIDGADTFGSKRQGLVLDNSDDCTIKIQIDGASDTNNNVYDAILLFNGSSRNDVRISRVRQGATFKTRYSISVDDAACIDNWVILNDFETGATGSILDNGTNTDTTSLQKVR